MFREERAEAPSGGGSRTVTGWTLEEVVGATGAVTTLVAGRFERVCTDSRKVANRSLFFALRGQFHDGHDHVAAALRQGALAAVVERRPPGVDPAALLTVADVQRALGDLAAFTRRRNPLRVAAITGSNGKTTTKELLAGICEQAFPAPGSVLKTHGNENNLIGLPLTLLRLVETEQVAVLEMGMNAPGEISRLTEIADPDAGVITNVGPAHLEGLGSVAGVAAAKGELFAGMRADACIAVNVDDPWVRRLAESFPGRRISFGAGGEVRALDVEEQGLEAIRFTLEVAGRRAPTRLPMPGAHNVSNALAAAALAHALGIDVESIAGGLAAAHPPQMRMQVSRLANGVTVINDGYNANPASMEAALRVLAKQPGRTVAVLGEMRELGPSSPLEHERVGALAATLGVGVLVALGGEGEHVAAGARGAGMANDDIAVTADPAGAARAVIERWKPGDTVLLKGSRGPDTEAWVRARGSRMAEVMRLLVEAGGNG